jgi:hypothetical protein
MSNVKAGEMASHAHPLLRHLSTPRGEFVSNVIPAPELRTVDAFFNWGGEVMLAAQAAVDL